MGREQSGRCRGRGATLPTAAVLASLLQLAAAALGSGASGADLARPNADRGPTPVRVALYLADLYEVSGSDQTIVADVILHAEWQDPRLAGRWTGRHGVSLDEIWDPHLLLVNSRDVTASLPLRAEVDHAGNVAYVQRWVGRFSVRMDLRDFPIDRQRFEVQIVTLGYGRDEVDLVTDSDRVMRSGRAAELSITDWEIGPARGRAADFTPSPGRRTLAGISLQWEGRRYSGYYAVQVIFPLILIVLMGWTALWVNASSVAVRVSMSTSAMLTLIAYRFSLSSLLPRLSYLTRFDFFMLASTVLIFMIVLLVAGGALLVGQGQEDLVRRLNRWALAGFPVIFAVVCGITWFW